VNTALARAALPTARAIRWAPAAAVSGVLLAAAVLARATDGPANMLVATAAAGLAATVVSGLYDPAASLLAAVPVSVMQRRLLRLTLLGLPALAVWSVFDRLTVAQVSGPGPLLALTACGVAVALWGPPRNAVLLGAATPVVLCALPRVVPSAAFSDVVAWWLTDPWWVLLGATLLCIAGRRR
jgi:hypothetical protein